MMPIIDLPHALIRGLYGTRLAKVYGSPIDMVALRTMKQYENQLRRLLTWRMGADTGLYEFRGMKFKKGEFLAQPIRFNRDWFDAWCRRRNILWPRTATGLIKTDKDTFADMAHVSPEIDQIRHLQSALSSLDLTKLAVGHDGRNRAHLAPFGTKTGRNQPSSNRFVFGLPKYLRHLVKPTPGHSIAQLDFAQQEVLIGARIYQDANLERDYQGEIYLNFGYRAGMVPADATAESHPVERELCKQCVLGVGYGMQAESLSYKIQRPPAYAQEMIDRHMRAYPDYRRNAQATVNYAQLHGSLETAFGWKLQVTPWTKTTTLQNFMVQATGAEILRIAIILAVEAGVTICAPVHDCLVIEAPTEHIADAIARTRAAMEEASHLLIGATLRIDVKDFHSPDRYREKKGAAMWNMVWDSILEIDPKLEDLVVRYR